MIDTVNVPREWLKRLDFFLHLTGVPRSHRERKTISAMLAAAPASDELLEAVEALLDTADHEGSRKRLGDGVDDDQWIDYMEVGKIELDRLQLLVDQHKGPQS